MRPEIILAEYHLRQIAAERSEIILIGSNVK